MLHKKGIRKTFSKITTTIVIYFMKVLDLTMYIC